MNLIVPTVGTDPGPDYATNVNTTITIVDSHNHSLGSGVQITPQGLNINSTLTIQNQALTNVGQVSLTSQVSTPATNGTVYEFGNDLYFLNGAGTNIQVTNASGVAGTPGSIGDLTAPANVFYVSANSTYYFDSNANTPANIAVAALNLSNIVANPNYLTLAPPLTISAPYTITLPNLPSSTGILQMSTSGAISNTLVPDNSTLQISGTKLQVAPGGITSTQIAAGTITGSNIANATIQGTNIAVATIVGSNIALNTVQSPNIQKFPESVSSSQTGAGNGSTNFQIASTNVTVTGGKNVLVVLIGNGASNVVLAGGTGVISIQMDGTTFSQYTMSPGTFYPNFIGFIPGTSISAGSHQFSVAGSSTAGQNITWEAVSVLAFELA